MSNTVTVTPDVNNVTITGDSPSVTVQEANVTVKEIGIQGPRGANGLGVPTTNLTDGALIPYNEAGGNFETVTAIPAQIVLNGGNF